jgi:hypothetical protein
MLKFKKFGWNGFFFQIPEEMRFQSEGGNAKKGYIRLESKSFLFEIKWEDFKSKKTVSLSEMAEAFMNQINKTKKQRLNILKKENTKVFSHDVVYMRLKSPRSDIIYMWFCDESKRVILIHLAFEKFDNLSKRKIEQILSTIRCHTKKLNKWSIFGINFTIPSSLLLTERKMSVGRARFFFKDQKVGAFSVKNFEILVEYFSMANLVFPDTYKDPDKWLKEKYSKDLKKKYRKFRIKIGEEKRINRHRGKINNGQSVSGLTSRKTSLYTNVTWYCSISNRMYSITFSTQLTKITLLKRVIDEKAHETLIKETLASFKCH